MPTFPLILACILVLASCAKEKSELVFELKNPQGVGSTPLNESSKLPAPSGEKVRPSYASLSQVLFKRSCLKCHDEDHADDLGEGIFLDHIDEVSERFQDIWDSLAKDCGKEVKCMPPSDKNGRAKAPLPTSEIIEALRDWGKEQGLFE